MSFVIDSSIALSWLLPDERGTPSDALIDRLVDSGAVAPSLWWLEVSNALLSARRRGRVGDRDVDRALALLGALPIVADVEPPTQLVGKIAALARKHGLTTYDASYLDLAQRRGWPLATIDAKLRAASAAEGITLLP